jgi:hypothetical protein
MPTSTERKILARWFAAMNAHTRTRITLANLKYDLGNKERVPLRRILRVLRTMLHAGIWKAGSSACDEAELALDTYLNDAPRGVFCQGRTIDKRKRLSLITDTDVFHKYYVRLAGRAMVIDRRPRSHRFHGILAEEVRENATVQGRRNFAWVTDSDALQKHIGTVTDRKRVPARVRDYLGLIFKKRNQQLIELRYPPEVAKTLPLAAPTVLEGACVTVYRSSDGADGWGAALDLDVLVDGAVEAVHPPIPFTAEFTYRELGVLEDDRVRTEDELGPLFKSPWTTADAALVAKLAKKTKHKKTKP